MKTLLKIRMTKYSSIFLFLSSIIIISVYFFEKYLSPALKYEKTHLRIYNNSNLTKYNYSLFGDNNYKKIKFKKTFIISNGDYEYAKYIKSKMNEIFGDIEIIENNKTIDIILNNNTYKIQFLYPVIEIKNKGTNNENKEIEIFFLNDNYNFSIPEVNVSDYNSNRDIFYSYLQITIINLLKNISNNDFPPTIKVESIPLINVYVKKVFIDIFDLKFFTIIYFFFFHLYSIYLFIRIVKEKENNLNDLLYRQGITILQNFLSWFIIYIIHFSIPFLLFSFLFSSLFNMKIYFFFIILFIHFLFLLNIFSLLLFLNILFTKHQMIFSILKIMYLISIMFLFLDYYSFRLDLKLKLFTTCFLVFPTHF